MSVVWLKNKPKRGDATWICEEFQVLYSEKQFYIAVLFKPYSVTQDVITVISVRNARILL